MIHRLTCQHCQRVTDHSYTRVERRDRVEKGRMVARAIIADMRCRDCGELWRYVRHSLFANSEYTTRQMGGIGWAG